jgi:hypothetical protein
LKRVNNRQVPTATLMRQVAPIRFREIHGSELNIVVIRNHGVLFTICKQLIKKGKSESKSKKGKQQ